VRGRGSFRGQAQFSFQGIAASPARGCAFTLVELLIILAVLAVLAAILLPSVSAAKQQARLAACAAQMRGVGSGLKVYAAVHGNLLPPFAFSDGKCNLPLSGHWGGMSQASHPEAFGRVPLWGMEHVNLWALAAEGMVTREQLICPGAEASLRLGRASYFPYTFKFSTYCLRMLYSRDLFRDVPGLADWGDLGLLGIYAIRGGGQVPPGAEDRGTYLRGYWRTVPMVRLDLPYREVAPGTGEQRTVDLTQAAILADTFWYQRHFAPAASMPGVEAYEVRGGWCHGRRFNVLFGDGAVHTLRDDDTIAGSSVAPGASVALGERGFASRALTVWRYFEDSR